jgi:hypothetical protein
VAFEMPRFFLLWWYWVIYNFHSPFPFYGANFSGCLSFKIAHNGKMFAKGGIDSTSLALRTMFIESTKA